MKIFKRVAIALSFLLLSGVAFAQATATGKISAMYVERGGNWVRLQLDTAAINPGSCPNADYYIVEFAAASNRGPMLAALYLAFAQRSTISMWISGCTAGSYWGSTRPAAVDLYLVAP